MIKWQSIHINLLVWFLAEWLIYWIGFYYEKNGLKIWELKICSKNFFFFDNENVKKKHIDPNFSINLVAFTI